ncbi:MAG TPA: hypothetical protein VGI66_10880 [Streptosporangiaceae bacterium]
MPEHPNAFLFASVSATFTSEPSAPQTGMPASITADSASSATSGLAACQNSSSITDGGTGTRQQVITFGVGMCHSRANGTCASSPASRRRGYQFPDHALAQVAFQFTQPHEIWQPAVSKHPPALDRHRGRHHRMAESHQRARATAAPRSPDEERRSAARTATMPAGGSMASGLAQTAAGR